MNIPEMYDDFVGGMNSDASFLEGKNPGNSYQNKKEGNSSAEVLGETVEDGANSEKNYQRTFAEGCAMTVTKDKITTGNEEETIKEKKIRIENIDTNLKRDRIVTEGGLTNRSKYLKNELFDPASYLSQYWRFRSKYFLVSIRVFGRTCWINKLQ